MTDRKRHHRSCGFTLIELLIVVAIIAILAAIAVPNFLTAQTRSKIARVKSDHRTMATAIESYCVDYTKYPPDQDNNPASKNEAGYSFITSPIAYIATIPSDPFAPDVRGNDKNNVDIAKFYEFASGSDARREGTPHPIIQCYFINCYGPDQKRNTGNDNFPWGKNLGDDGVNVRPYDSTNGMKSAGDIFRFGGAYMGGNWRIWGIDHHVWGNVPNVMPQ